MVPEEDLAIRACARKMVLVSEGMMSLNIGDVVLDAIFATAVLGSAGGGRAYDGSHCHRNEHGSEWLLCLELLSSLLPSRRKTHLKDPPSHASLLLSIFLRRRSHPLRPRRRPIHDILLLH